MRQGNIPVGVPGVTVSGALGWTTIVTEPLRSISKSSEICDALEAWKPGTAPFSLPLCCQLDTSSVFPARI
jgi:hypothetical protein